MLKRRFAGAAMLLTVMAGGLVATSAPAAAAPELQLPFPCGQKWRLNTWTPHAPALDMVREPQIGNRGLAGGRPGVRHGEPAYYHEKAGNMIQINHGGGHFTTYIHLQSRAVSVGDRITQGQTIGRVGHTGPTSNEPRTDHEQGYTPTATGPSPGVSRALSASRPGSTARRTAPPPATSGATSRARTAAGNPTCSARISTRMVSVTSS